MPTHRSPVDQRIDELADEIKGLEEMAAGIRQKLLPPAKLPSAAEIVKLRDELNLIASTLETVRNERVNLVLQRVILNLKHKHKLLGHD